MHRCILSSLIWLWLIPANSHAAVTSSAVQGYVGDVVAGAGGTVAVTGWACRPGDLRSIAVDLYVNGPIDEGDYVGRYNADSPSEPAVSRACQTRGMAYRFSIPIDKLSAAHAGQPIYIYAPADDAVVAPTALIRSGGEVIPGRIDTLEAAPVKLERHASRGGEFKLVDCTQWGNCSNNVPACPKVGKCAADSANALGYAYGPAIIKSGNQFHVFYCSRGGNTGNRASNAWDAIRYVHSTDAKNWSHPIVKLTASSSLPTAAKPDGTRDLAACDPSVVRWGAFYYLFYSSAYVSAEANTLTVIQVARSSRIDGTFLTYTTRGTWENSPDDPHMIILPLSDIANSYGSGQPSVVVWRGRLRMWYTDTTDDATNSGRHIYMLESRNPVSWRPDRSARTDIEATDVDVKFEDASGKFIVYLCRDTSDGLPELLTSVSADGMHWSSPIPANVVQPVLNYHVDSVGASSDELGHSVPGEAVMIAFGAPYSLSTVLPDISRGAWSLYGLFTSAPK